MTVKVVQTNNEYWKNWQERCRCSYKLPPLESTLDSAALVSLLTLRMTVWACHTSQPKKTQRKIKKEKQFWWGHLESGKIRTSKLFENNIWYTKMHRCYMKPSWTRVELVFACNIPEQSVIIFSKALTGSLWPHSETQDVTLLNPLAYL